jgi:hypothetical protein
MTTTTTTRGLPKPEATDPLANGYDAIADLADALDADLVGTGANAGKRLHWLAFAGTPDASGYLVVTHGAGFTPTNVQVTANSPISGPTSFGQGIVDTLTSTTFRVRCLTPAGAALTTAVAGFALVLE